MNKWTYLIGGLVILFLIWVVVGWWFVKDIETPNYDVVETRDGYEVRVYEPYIVAETAVRAGSETDNLNEGFRIVADYIFGNNHKNESVSMTAPVLAGEEGTVISMTAPVLSEKMEGQTTVSFVMPSEYTLETLPEPNNDKVSLREVASRRVAALGFQGYTTDSRIMDKKLELIELLERDDITVKGMPYYAGYNPPFTIPFMQYHEILVEIE